MFIFQLWCYLCSLSLKMWLCLQVSSHIKCLTAVCKHLPSLETALINSNQLQSAARISFRSWMIIYQRGRRCWIRATGPAFKILKMFVIQKSLVFLDCRRNVFNSMKTNPVALIQPFVSTSRGLDGWEPPQTSSIECHTPELPKTSRPLIFLSLISACLTAHLVPTMVYKPHTAVLTFSQLHHTSNASEIWSERISTQRNLIFER